MWAGTTTLAREDLDRGIEADASFYFWDLSRVSDPDNLNLEVAPPPRSRHRDRDHTIRAEQAGNLWGPESSRNLEIRRINGSNSPAPGRWLVRARSSVSKALPWITIDEIQRFAVKEAKLDHGQWARSFRRWVRKTVVPRFRAEHGGE